LNSGQATPNRVPILSVLGCSLPPEGIMRMLLEEYFESVHWFSLVIYEPKFRAQFESICDGHARLSQKPFLLLLSTILGIAAWYCSKRSGRQTWIGVRGHQISLSILNPTFSTSLTKARLQTYRRAFCYPLITITMVNQSQLLPFWERQLRPHKL
jgi:hypothetical protein